MTNRADHSSTEFKSLLVWAQRLGSIENLLCTLSNTVLLLSSGSTGRAIKLCINTALAVCYQFTLSFASIHPACCTSIPASRADKRRQTDSRGGGNRCRHSNGTSDAQAMQWLERGVNGRC